MDLIKEACVENVEDAIKAQVNGVNRLELCDRLDLDGTSPPIELIKEVLKSVSIPIKVMVRTRPGDFIYTRSEADEMIDYIKEVIKLGVNEFVLGCTTKDRRLDVATIKYITEGLPNAIFTIHKAIDICKDPVGELEPLKSIKNIKYVLTSGGAKTALEGQHILNQMIDAASPDITIVVAGKVTVNNLLEVTRCIKATEFHGRRIVF